MTAYSKQIGEWCDRNGLLYTGHVLEEDSLSRQVATTSACMRFYEYMQAPGMDMLTERRRIYDTAKQVSSAARQFGRKWRLTETYGCTGWDFPFAGHKALGDWQVALGINLRCQHLYWYTMLGEAKRDFPGPIGEQSPWWTHYAKVEDYFARLHAALAAAVAAVAMVIKSRRSGNIAVDKFDLVGSSLVLHTRLRSRSLCESFSQPECSSRRENSDRRERDRQWDAADLRPTEARGMAQIPGPNREQRLIVS